MFRHDRSSSWPPRRSTADDQRQHVIPNTAASVSALCRLAEGEPKRRGGWGVRRQSPGRRAPRLRRLRIPVARARQPCRPGGTRRARRTRSGAKKPSPRRRRSSPNRSRAGYRAVHGEGGENGVGERRVPVVRRRLEVITACSFSSRSGASTCSAASRRNSSRATGTNRSTLPV